LGAQQVLVRWDGGSGTRKEVETIQGKEGAGQERKSRLYKGKRERMKQLHENFEGEGFKATPLEARTGEGGGGRERALLKYALEAHVVLEFLHLPTI
jgi:hypothetical protein